MDLDVVVVVVVVAVAAVVVAVVVAVFVSEFSLFLRSALRLKTNLSLTEDRETRTV